jgi:hypothetical protein
MFIVTKCGTGELRQEFHVHRCQQTHFTPGGVRIASDAVAINMQHSVVELPTLVGQERIL